MSSPGDPAAAPVAGAGNTGSSENGSMKDWLNTVKADEKQKPPVGQEIKSNDLGSFFGKVEKTYVVKGKVKQLVYKGTKRPPSKKSAEIVTVTPGKLPGADFTCPHCPRDCKTPQGLASHLKFRHPPNSTAKVRRLQLSSSPRGAAAAAGTAASTNASVSPSSPATNDASPSPAQAPTPTFIIDAQMEGEEPSVEVQVVEPTRASEARTPSVLDNVKKKRHRLSYLERFAIVTEWQELHAEDPKLTQQQYCEAKGPVVSQSQRP